MRVKLDFDNCYEIDEVSVDLRQTVFTTTLADATNKPLHVQISNEAHDLIPNLFNLAFGPLDKKGRIDDKAELQHANYSKVFSTILLSALTYLTQNPNHYLGIDGSSEARAYLYYRFIQMNYKYLNTHFNLYGLKYYVRISRFGKMQYDNPFDFDDIHPEPCLIKEGVALTGDNLYNYFVFSLKK